MWESLAQAKRRVVTSTQTEELAIHLFSEKWLKLNQELAHQSERRVLKSFADALLVLETGENEATNVRS